MRDDEGMTGGVRIVESGKLTFYITPSRTIVCTSLQTFCLEASEYYWNKRMRNLTIAIELGKVQSLDDLSHWLSVYDDAGVYIGQCIKLIPYKKAWIVA